MKKRSRSVIVTGFIGLKGTAVLAEKYKEKIDSHYPVYLSRNAEHIADSTGEDACKAQEIILKHIEQLEGSGSGILQRASEKQGISAYENVTDENSVDKVPADENSVTVMPVIEIAEGGFLTAMWELAKRAGQGFTVDLRKVPLKQETVEICELTEVNPYHLCSYGAVVAVVPDGRLLAEQLEKNGIPSAIIGYTNATKAHILMNDGTESHLNRPEPDELVRLGLRQA